MGRLGAAISTAIAIGIGLLTLIGLLAGDNVPLVNDIADFLLQLVVITTAITVLIGVVNLFSVHARRVGRRDTGWGYSLLVIVATLLVIVLVLLERAGALGGRPSTILFETVQISIESALAGLVLFALVYGAYRLTRRRLTWPTVLFVVVLLLLLLGALPLAGLGPLVSIRDWLMAVPVSAGARGILLGIALGTVVTGVRVLVGQDRSYRE
ncbi:MAG: hypothetical protein HZC41_08830 [Chloroflexi bacterium]|nr:hypothetical protein [Chloroflexota bacterium]